MTTSPSTSAHDTDATDTDATDTDTMPTDADDTSTTDVTDAATGPAGAGADDAAATGGIVLSGVRMVFPTGRRSELVAIDRLDFDVRPGEFVSLLGPSGCGKSTALRMVAGLEHPTRGRVEVLGQTPEAVVGAHRLGIAFQDHALLPWLTVRQNVILPFKATGRSVDEAEVDELIELVGLSSAADMRPSQLSGGMRQRASIARALVLRPELLLLDEPFGALDAVTRRRLNLELQRVWSEHRITTLMVTHAVDEAVLLSDRVVVMTNRPGRVRDIVDIPFDRPRTAELTSDPAFHALEDRLTRALLDETSDGD
jgi:NitT/TauT family transport system ATP-binding protein